MNQLSSQQNIEAFESLPVDIFTKKGLIKCSDLVFFKEDYSYIIQGKNLEKIYVAPTKYASPVVHYLSSRRELWKKSAIRIQPYRNICSRAPMYGVPFRKAINKALSNRLPIKSEFYLPDQRDDVFYATLLIHVNKYKKDKKTIFELQAWQYCPESPEVFYIHAESPDFIKIATHFDGAIIYLTPDEIKRLFTSGNKIKSDTYKKQFRIYGSIQYEDMVNIISEYLPTEELVGEAFETRELP